MRRNEKTKGKRGRIDEEGEVEVAVEEEGEGAGKAKVEGEAGGKKGEGRTK